MWNYILNIILVLAMSLPNNTLALSALDVKGLTGWPDKMVEDYLNINRVLAQLAADTPGTFGTMALQNADDVAITGGSLTNADNPLIIVATSFTGPLTGNVTGNLTGNADTASLAATVTTNANLTGPVTSVGNATAIANGALSYQKLANGTAGNVITWDAAGVIAVVATGTAAQVLTSNGAGTAPTFQAVSASAITTANSTDTTAFMGFWDDATGSQQPKTNAAFTVNATSGRLSATIIGTDTVSENTAAAGVTADGVLLKDGGINISGALALSGQIVFPATKNASSGANTLDDYEFGTWTPIDSSGAGLTFSSVTASYVIIGDICHAGYRVTYPATADVTAATIGGLPATCENTTAKWGGPLTVSTIGVQYNNFVNANATTFQFGDVSGNAATNVTLTGKVVAGALTFKI